MADQRSPQDVFQAMHRLWFDQNIMKKMPTSISEAPQPPPPSAAVAGENTNKSNVASTAISTPHQSKEGERSVTPTVDIVTRNHSELQFSTIEPWICQSHPHLSKQPRKRAAKMRSWKSFSELEHEELKGFRDLGFEFNKEKLSPHIKKMLPGLQMLGEKQVMTRPYLSEAWLINRPDSPLLNFQIPPVSTSPRADVKKHLRCWARTVAYVINQKS